MCRLQNRRRFSIADNFESDSAFLLLFRKCEIPKLCFFGKIRQEGVSAPSTRWPRGEWRVYGMSAHRASLLRSRVSEGTIRHQPFSLSLLVLVFERHVVSAEVEGQKWQCSTAHIKGIDCARWTYKRSSAFTVCRVTNFPSMYLLA